MIIKIANKQEWVRRAKLIINFVDAERKILSEKNSEVMSDRTDSGSKSSDMILHTGAILMHHMIAYDYGKNIYTIAQDLIQSCEDPGIDSIALDSTEYAEFTSWYETVTQHKMAS